MKSTFTKICFIFLSFIISFGAYGHGTIIFPNVEHGDGFIDVKIYDSKESFLDEDLAIESVRKRVKKGEGRIGLKKDWDKFMWFEINPDYNMFLEELEHFLIRTFASILKNDVDIEPIINSKIKLVNRQLRKKKI